MDKKIGLDRYGRSMFCYVSTVPCLPGHWLTKDIYPRIDVTSVAGVTAAGFADLQNKAEECISSGLHALVVCTFFCKKLPSGAVRTWGTLST